LCLLGEDAVDSDDVEVRIAAQVRAGPLHDGDGGVEATSDDVDQPVLEDELDLDSRMPLPKLPQHGSDHEGIRAPWDR